MSTTAIETVIEIRALVTGEDATAFRKLNEEWINRHYALEAKDIEVLGDPEGTILRKGGHIYMVFAGGEAVGCVALIPMREGVFEVAKMAVSPALRGRGIGRRLLEYAIADARKMGTRSLFLGSGRQLKDAVHLYESVGFRHVAPEALPPMPYARADVFMEMRLEDTPARLRAYRERDPGFRQAIVEFAEAEAVCEDPLEATIENLAEGRG